MLTAEFLLTGNTSLTLAPSSNLICWGQPHQNGNQKHNEQCSTLSENLIYRNHAEFCFASPIDFKPLSHLTASMGWHKDHHVTLLTLPNEFQKSTLKWPS